MDKTLTSPQRGRNDPLARIEGMLLSIPFLAIVVMMIIISLDALGRYIFDKSVFGVKELSGDYLMPSVVFLALSHAFVRGDHVKIEYFTKFIPERILVVGQKILFSLSLVFWGFVAWGGVQNTIRAFHRGDANTVGWVMYPAFFLVPLGTLLLCVRIGQTILFTNQLRVRERQPG